MDRALVPSIGRGLRRDQFGDADQIVGDQVEQEIGSNSGDAAVLGLTHCTVLFAPAEDAFGHRPARLRDVSFLRFCPWKLAPPSSSPLPSLGRKLFCEAQASISVPSTEKCSSDNSGLTCGWFKSLVMNLANTSPFCSRSRFLVNTVGSHTGSSGESPTNQRYRRL